MLSEECKNQIAAMGIADELGIDLEGRSFFSIILPLLIIPLIGMLLVYINKFSPTGRHGPKKETKEAKKQPSKTEIKTPTKPSFEKQLDQEIDDVEKKLRESLGK